jgi:L-ascorbate metabolism protein UlaG (beta-lactamase superfamily)
VEEKKLELTWLGHSTFRVDSDGFRMVIDPGIVAPPDAMAGADGVLITHEHGDHFQPNLIAAAAAARRGLQIWANKSVAALLTQSGAASGAKVHVIGHGDAFEAGGLPYHVYGEWHAPIHPDVVRVRNTGFLIGRAGHEIFHPGDALTDPCVPVDLLLVPEFGLYTKLGNTIDFIRQIKPKRAAPIHDTGLDPAGLAGVDGFLAEKPTPPFAPGTGAPFTRLSKGTPINI